jgi:hypothetical protein
VGGHEHIHVSPQAMTSLQVFKTQNAFWAAFVVQSDFQKHAKANFTVIEIDTNMQMTKEGELTNDGLRSMMWGGWGYRVTVIRRLMVTDEFKVSLMW